MTMKAIAIGAAIAALCISPLLIGTAGAQTMQSPTPSGKICLNLDWPQAVDHTKTVDASTVLFYMKDGKVWQNNLKSPCPGLILHGFTYTAQQGELCANGPINVIETHEACSLGPFSPYAAPMQHASLAH
jgi:hypothetical protein